MGESARWLQESVGEPARWLQSERRQGERRKEWSPEDENSQVAVSVILPAYNEAAALPTVLTELSSVLGAWAEVIVVDDGSTDNTAAIASQYPCRLLVHEQNRGKGAAVRSGLAAARGQFIIIMDADNTYPVELVPRMAELSREFDFVRCARVADAASMPRTNRVGNWIFDRVLKILHGLEGGDHLSGLYGLRADVLRTMQFTADKFDLEVEIGIKARAQRLRSAVIPANYGQRLGKKKLRPYRDGWSILHRALSMALLYNPGLAFVVPGAVIWGLTVLVATAVGVHPLTVGKVTLSDHSLILATLGMNVGLQLVVFGIAATLYGVQRGAAPRPWLLTLGSRSARLAAILVGTGLAVGGLAKLGALLAAWIGAGGSGFHDTRGLVWASALLSLGVEVVVAALFLSIFADRLVTDSEPAGPAHAAADQLTTRHRAHPSSELGPL